MKKSKIILLILTISAFEFISTPNVYGCSMVKLTKNGKTVVGNNEDWFNPNTRIWFETGKNGGFGAMYVGFENMFPQGGMNEAGLVFDGFGQSYRAVTDTIGKLKISPGDLYKKIMRECATVDDVKNLFNQYNRSFWSSSVLRFIDKSGKYLYVDGDSLIIGDNATFVQTNVRPYENKECWRLEKATKIISSSYNTSIDFCASVMDSVHQGGNWGGSVYTTIYDLNEGKIYLYYFYDYKHVVTFDLKDELQKGDRFLFMPELFPENETGQKFYAEFNKIYSQIRILGDSSIADKTAAINAIKNEISNSFIDSYPFFRKVTDFAEYYKSEKADYPTAILYLRLNVEIYPDDWRVHNTLANMYFKNKDYQQAISSYQRSVELNPDNTSAKKQIDYLKKLISN